MCYSHLYQEYDAGLLLQSKLSEGDCLKLHLPLADKADILAGESGVKQTKANKSYYPNEYNIIG